METKQRRQYEILCRLLTEDWELLWYIGDKKILHTTAIFFLNAHILSNFTEGEIYNNI